MPNRPNVFPTGVGMNRGASIRDVFNIGVPHGCGDEPPITEIQYGNYKCSPRVWG